MGEFVKAFLEDHDKNFSKVARRAGMSPQNMSDLFLRAEIGPDVLLSVHNASKLDLVGAIQEEMKRLGLAQGNVLSDPAALYKPTPVEHSDGTVKLTIRMDDYTAEGQAQLISFLAALPKRTQSAALQGKG